MTDQLDQAIIAAGLALLAADAALTGRVFDGAVPNPTPAPPWVLVYSSVEWPADDPDDSLSGKTTKAVARWYCHCVGGNGQAAREIGQHVRTQLMDQRVVVAGTAPGLIRHEQDQPPVRDESTGVVVMDSVHVFRLTFVL